MFGAFNSQGVPVMASTASAPPTPIAMVPRPPAFGVCESEDLQSRQESVVCDKLLTSAQPVNQSIGVPQWERKDLHQHTGCSIVFQYDLVDDTRSRSPKFDTVFQRCTLKEVKNFLVCDNGTLNRISLEPVLFNHT
jgi:hypothetical protein